MTAQPYYSDELVTLWHGDCRDFEQPEGHTLVVDPPWDDVELGRYLLTELLYLPGVLVFTGPRRMAQPIRELGAPTWLFVWDTMSPWNTGPRRPVQQTKLCLWYGDLDAYDRDRVLWGSPPPVRDHPTTKQEPLAGRRLVDLHSVSLRWLHHPKARSGEASGASRFSERSGDPALRHAKPLEWVRCLIGNTSELPVFDPCAGSGTSLVAAKSLGRRAWGIEIDEAACEAAALRLSGELVELEEERPQTELFTGGGS